MSALFDIALRSAKTADQKVAQSGFGRRQIVGRVHGPENVIARNLPVKGTNQPSEPFLPDARVDLVFWQIHNDPV
jgi:hypothetical protein